MILKYWKRDVTAFWNLMHDHQVRYPMVLNCVSPFAAVLPASCVLRGSCDACVGTRGRGKATTTAGLPLVYASTSDVRLKRINFELLLFTLQILNLFGSHLQAFFVSCKAFKD